MRTVLAFFVGARVSFEKTLRWKQLFNATLALSVMMTVSPCSAEQFPVQIDHGSLVIDLSTHVGRIDFSGRRLYFTSTVSDLFGVFVPGRCNVELPCLPGTTIGLGAAWVGSDIRGTATLDGIEYPDVGGPNSPSSMSVQFAGSLVLPPLAPSASVSAPFTLTGEFRHPVGAMDALAGRGLATVFLSSSQSFPGAWRVDRVEYRFASGLPPPWSTADVGTVGQTGHAAAGPSEGLSPTFFVDGAGADIWGMADAFHFVSRPFSNEGEIAARVAAQEPTHPFAKAGVMLRSSLDPSSPYVILDVKPDGGLELMARYASGQDTVFIAGGQAASTPWLKLVRSGNEVTGLHSGDGLTWTSVGSVVLASMPSDLIAGLAVTSHEPALLNHAVFDNVRVSSHTHNLLMFESFEEYGPELGPRPELGPIGWISDHAYRQTPAKGETNQPHSGTRNGACWTPEYLDCGLYQDVIAPVTGSYTLRLFANADRAGGLVGANVNGMLAAYREVEVRGFRNYGFAYSMSFEASAGDAIRVWMYSPAAPGYVVIDDVSVMLDRTLVVTEGEWTIGGPGLFGRFTLRGEEFVVEGSYDGGVVEPLSICGPSGPGRCEPGQMLGLFSSFENYTPHGNVSFARGRAIVAERSWWCTSAPCQVFLEFGGELHLAGGVVTLPTPTGTDDPTLVSMTAPFTFSGNLKGFEVPRLVPKLVFDLPLTGRGTATLELLSRPSASGPTMWFYRLRYAFEPDAMTLR